MTLRNDNNNLLDSVDAATSCIETRSTSQNCALENSLFKKDFLHTKCIETDPECLSIFDHSIFLNEKDVKTIPSEKTIMYEIRQLLRDENWHFKWLEHEPYGPIQISMTVSGRSAVNLEVIITYERNALVLTFPILATVDLSNKAQVSRVSRGIMHLNRRLLSGAFTMDSSPDKNTPSLMQKIEPGFGVVSFRNSHLVLNGQITPKQFQRMLYITVSTADQKLPVIYRLLDVVDDVLAHDLVDGSLPVELLPDELAEPDAEALLRSIVDNFTFFSKTSNIASGSQAFTSNSALLRGVLRGSDRSLFTAGPAVPSGRGSIWQIAAAAASSHPSASANDRTQVSPRRRRTAFTTRNRTVHDEDDNVSYGIDHHTNGHVTPGTTSRLPHRVTSLFVPSSRIANPTSFRSLGGEETPSLLAPAPSPACVSSPSAMPTSASLSLRLHPSTRVAFPVDHPCTPYEFVSASIDAPQGIAIGTVTTPLHDYAQSPLALGRQSPSFFASVSSSPNQQLDPIFDASPAVRASANVRMQRLSPPRQEDTPVAMNMVALDGSPIMNSSSSASLTDCFMSSSILNSNVRSPRRSLLPVVGTGAHLLIDETGEEKSPVRRSAMAADSEEEHLS